MQSPCECRLCQSRQRGGTVRFNDEQRKPPFYTLLLEMEADRGRPRRRRFTQTAHSQNPHVREIRRIVRECRGRQGADPSHHAKAVDVNHVNGDEQSAFKDAQVGRWRTCAKSASCSMSRRISWASCVEPPSPATPPPTPRHPSTQERGAQAPPTKARSSSPPQSVLTRPLTGISFASCFEPPATPPPSNSRQAQRRRCARER